MQELAEQLGVKSISPWAWEETPGSGNIIRALKSRGGFEEAVAVMIQAGKVLVLRQPFHPRSGKGSADFAALLDAGLGWALSCLSPRGTYLHHFNSWRSHIPPGQAMPPVYMWHHLHVRWLHQVVCKQSVLERCPKRGCDKRREGRVFPQDQEHEWLPCRAKPHVLGQLGHQKQASRGQAVCCGPASPPGLQGEWRPRF